MQHHDPDPAHTAAITAGVERAIARLLSSPDLDGPFFAAIRQGVRDGSGTSAPPLRHASRRARGLSRHNCGIRIACENQARRTNSRFQTGPVRKSHGRPKGWAETQELARQQGPAAIRALVEALKRPNTQVQAAVALLDRGFGRPVALHEITHHVDAMRLTDAELTALAAAGWPQHDGEDDLSPPVH